MEKAKLSLTIGNNDKSRIKSNNSWTKFGVGRPYFSFASAPKNGNVQQVTAFRTCREDLCEFVRCETQGKTNFGMCLTKLRMLKMMRLEPSIKTFTSIDRKMAAGLKMVNIIEQHYGWPLTKVYPVELANIAKATAKRYRIHYIVGSKRWLKAPAMLSLFVLLLRIGANNITAILKQLKTNNLEDLIRILDDITKRSRNSDIAYYREHGKTWLLVLKNYNRLFRRRTIQDFYFPEDRTTGYLYNEGIALLCDRGSADRILKNKIAKILVEQR